MTELNYDITLPTKTKSAHNFKNIFHSIFYSTMLQQRNNYIFHAYLSLNKLDSSLTDLKKEEVMFKMFSYNIRLGKPARRDYRSMFSSRGRTLRGCLIDDFKSMDPPSDSTDFIIFLLARPSSLNKYKALWFFWRVTTPSCSNTSSMNDAILFCKYILTIFCISALIKNHEAL